MSKGERPQALGQSLQKSFATRWAPVGGLLFWGFDRRSTEHVAPGGRLPSRAARSRRITRVRRKLASNIKFLAQMNKSRTGGGTTQETTPTLGGAKTGLGD
jgi:hypothetical protein